MRNATRKVLLLILAIVVLIVSLIATAWLANNGYAYAVLFGALWCVGWLIVVIRLRCRLGPERDPSEGSGLKAWFRREHSRSLRLAIAAVVVMVPLSVFLLVYVPQHASYKTARGFLRGHRHLPHYLGSTDDVHFRGWEGKALGAFVSGLPVEYRFHLTGPAGRGIACVTVESRKGRWEVSSATLELQGGYDIPLLDDASSSAAGLEDHKETEDE